MDPLSITAACSSLAFALVRNGRALTTVFEKYQNAQHSIFMIQTECTVLAAALSQLESTITGNKGARLSKYPSSVVEAIDLSLTGCSLTLSVLEKEVTKLIENAVEVASRMGKSDRAKYVWKEGSMNELLQQLRGQSSALTFLLKALDSVSIEQILRAVQEGQPIFEKVRGGAASIREAYPTEEYAESILDTYFDDNKTIYSLKSNAADGVRSESWDNSNTVPSAGRKASGQSKTNFLPQGWERVYSTEYNQWFYVNTATRRSQWDHPGNLPAATHSVSSTSADRGALSPQCARISSERRQPAGLILTYSTLAIKGNNNGIEDNGDEVFDMTPWLLNTRLKFETYLDSLRKEHAVPACAVGVVAADGPPELFVRGSRRSDCQVPVTKADKFTLSINETMTCVILAMLVDRGLITWDERLVDHIPASVSRRVHPFHKETTFSMVASSNSGISDSWWQAGNGDLLRYLSRSEISAKQGRFAVALYYLVRPPDHTPGTKAVWHQANGVLIALALEEITNQPFESLLKALLFDPLEMYSTGFGWPDITRNIVTSPRQPWGHAGTSKEPRGDFSGQGLNMNACYPFQGIHCSAADYAIYIKFELRCSMGLDTKGLLSQQGMKEMFERISDEEHSCNRAGWIIASRDWAKGLTFSNAGHQLGASNGAWIAPLTGKAFFSISNIDGTVGFKANDEAIYAAVRYARDSKSER